MPILADEAKLISIFIQSVLYGAYTVLFVLTSWVLVYRRQRGRPVHKTMFGISLVMFILATMHIGVNFTRIIKAFIIFRNEPGGPAAFFNELSEFTQIFGSTIYVAQTLVGDGVVLYRCYLVWGRRRSIIAFPCILFMGSFVTGVGILYSFARVEPDAEVFVQKLQEWIISFFSSTFSTNVICTGLVASRIWFVNRQTSVFTGYSMRPIIFLVIESGAVYSLTLLVLLILYKAQSWFQYVLLDAVSPIVGLVFSMIIIRIGLGITTPAGETVASSKPSKGWRSRSSASETPQDFSGHVELGAFKAAPNESVLLDSSFSRPSGGASVLDGKARSDTKLDDDEKECDEDLV
ncbi:hypothetical protein AX14_001946 [Amanita brunnescens Koide BX004]|nr:hypothetical protein AX14_001946 [Amanita brunnescens Koide BX004]